MAKKNSPQPEHKTPSNVVIGSVTITPGAGGTVHASPTLEEFTTRSRLEAELREEDRAKRAKWAIARWAKQRQKLIERDRSIHDEHKSGVSPKTIAGKNGLSASRVRRILSKPHP